MPARVFDPLPAGHPAVGRACAACDVPFDAGDRTALRNVRPEADDDQALRARAAGRAYTGVADLCHEQCPRPPKGSSVPADAKPVPGAVGVYELDGDMHIDAVEFLLAVGIEPSPENIDVLERTAADVARRHGIRGVAAALGHFPCQDHSVAGRRRGQ